MGNPAMELSQEQKNFIGEYIRGHYQELISPFTENRSISEREMEIRERIVRVEESLDKLYELMRQGFDQMDKRFELLTDQMNARFESITEQTNARFEQVDKRFNQMFAYFTTGMVLLGVLITAFQVFG
jgi:DNA anti-recombination protein RmuC